MTNIAKLLKDCPKWTKLYSPLFGEVEFVRIDKQSGYPIYVTDCNGNGKSFTEFGVYFADHPDAECLLFPSKEIRTWEGWEAPIEPKFKVGDWITDGNITIQIKDVRNNSYMYSDGVLYSTKTADKVYYLWSIQDAKDGDVLAADECYVIFKEIDGLNIKCYCTYHYMGFNPSFHIDTLQNKTAFKPATPKERTLLFKKMQEAGYQWYAGEKELKKIPIPKHYAIVNFKPFDKVLVRDGNSLKWTTDLFSYIDDGFVCTGGIAYRQCIPYNEKTKHLLGTTDMPSEEYINW